MKEDSKVTSAERIAADNDEAERLWEEFWRTGAPMVYLEYKSALLSAKENKTA